MSHPSWTSLPCPTLQIAYFSKLFESPNIDILLSLHLTYQFSSQAYWLMFLAHWICLAGRQVTLGTNTVVEFYAWKESNPFVLFGFDGFFFFHQKITRLLHDATLIFLDSCINTLFFQNYSYWNSTLFAVEQNTVQDGYLFWILF